MTKLNFLGLIGMFVLAIASSKIGTFQNIGVALMFVITAGVFLANGAYRPSVVDATADSAPQATENVDRAKLLTDIEELLEGYRAAISDSDKFNKRRSKDFKELKWIEPRTDYVPGGLLTVVHEPYAKYFPELRKVPSADLKGNLLNLDIWRNVHRENDVARRIDQNEPFIRVN